MVIGNLFAEGDKLDLIQGPFHEIEVFVNPLNVILAVALRRIYTIQRRCLRRVEPNFYAT